MIETERPAMDPERLAVQVQELAARLESIEDPHARETAQELVGAMLELYGIGLERIFEVLGHGGPEAVAVRDELAGDGVVASLLLIHGLHPVDLETRVSEALDRVRPYMGSHGGGVELVGISDDVAYLRLEGNCDGCAASASTLELAIRQALEESAPDLVRVEVEGVVAPARAATPFAGKELPLAAPSPAKPAWVSLDGIVDLAGGATQALDVGGVRVLVANVGGTLLAYRNACAGCEEPLDRAELEGGELACAACGRRFELPLAGRVLGDEVLQLTPIPLLHEDGRIRVALAA